MKGSVKAWLFALSIAGCSPPPAPQEQALASDQAAVRSVSQDPAFYQEYAWPEEWPLASDESGVELHDARVAKREGDRQIVVFDSASAFFGHEGKLDRTVLVFASHCGRNTAQLVNSTRPLGAIGHDAGVGLHAAGVQCTSLGDELDLPVATVSADTAYIGVGMSLWTTGRISVVNTSALALGVHVGMSTQEAASIMLAEAKTRQP